MRIYTLRSCRTSDDLRGGQFSFLTLTHSHPLCKLRTGKLLAIMPPQMGLAKTHFLRDAKLSSLLEPESTVLHTASKVVCTLGPACRDVETLVELLNAGMTAARVDLTVRPKPSSGTIPPHSRAISMSRHFKVSVLTPRLSD